MRSIKNFIRGIIPLIPGLVLIPFNSCVDIPDKLLIPEWDVELNIPIINKTHNLQEIIRSQKYITTDTIENGNIFLLQSGDYYFNTGMSEFVQLDEESSLDNIPVITSDTDSFAINVPFPDSAEVDNALIDDGTILFNVSNPSPVDAEIILRFPGFKDPNGNEVILQQYAEGGQSNSLTYFLAGNTYNISDDPSSDLRNFKVIIKALSSQPGNLVYTSLTLSGLSFDHITGKLPAKSIGIHTSSYDFDVDNIEEYRNKVVLKDAKLELKVYYLSIFETPAGTEVKKLNIIGKRNNGGEFLLRDETGNPDFNYMITGETFHTNFTKENSNVVDFVTYFPDSVILIAEYIVNPENRSGTFSRFDSIKADAKFSALSYLALDRITIDEKKRIVISEIDREDIRKGLFTEVHIEIENFLPLNAWLRVDMADINNNYLFTITKNQEGDSISFNGAEINENGEVVSPYLNPVKTIILNKEQIEMFSNSYYVSYSVSFNTKDSEINPPPIVAVRPSSWIKIKAIGKVRYPVDDLNK